MCSLHFIIIRSVFVFLPFSLQSIFILTVPKAKVFEMKILLPTTCLFIFYFVVITRFSTVCNFPHSKRSKQNMTVCSSLLVQHANDLWTKGFLTKYLIQNNRDFRYFVDDSCKEMNVITVKENYDLYRSFSKKKKKHFACEVKALKYFVVFFKY